ncbi:MAG: hypothetical protein MUF77_04865 [Leptospira sp.]|jgi:hypothetical protein|nr:hypothetical protein [Leptospira sp.]
MKYSLVYLILISFGFGILSKTTLSYRERKKQFDGKITLVTELKENLGLQVDEGKNSVESLKKDVEESYRAGGRVQMEKALGIAEGEVHYLQRKLCSPMEEIAGNLYQKAMGDWIILDTEDKSSSKKLDWDTKEKIQRYLSMAKSEKDHAKDYFLSGNFHRSLHTYKKSIVYSLLSLRSQKSEVPDEFKTADQIWVEPILLGNKKTTTIQEN